MIFRQRPTYTRTWTTRRSSALPRRLSTALTLCLSQSRCQDNSEKRRCFSENIAQNSAFGGAGGIRTHGRVLAVKRFRVVLVMTTSIPLRILTLIFVPRFLERHSGEKRFPPLLRRTPEALILLDFLTVSFLLKPVISSQPRYDHFDTAAQCITLYPAGREKSSVVCGLARW